MDMIKPSNRLKTHNIYTAFKFMAITHSFVTFKMQARLVIHLAKQDTDPF
jgi:hypothetical protein